MANEVRNKFVILVFRKLRYLCQPTPQWVQITKNVSYEFSQRNVGIFRSILPIVL